jgi:hypothetical protein
MISRAVRNIIYLLVTWFCLSYLLYYFKFFFCQKKFKILIIYLFMLTLRFLIEGIEFVLNKIPLKNCSYRKSNSKNLIMFLFKLYWDYLLLSCIEPTFDYISSCIKHQPGGFKINVDGVYSSLKGTSVYGVLYVTTMVSW